MKVIVFLSTGRCGTQFFTRYLAAAAGDRAVVTHEPIGAKYAPKQTLRASSLDELLPRYPAVDAHFAEIARVINAGQTYVETGWPVFSWVPLLIDRFGDELLLMHLTRHPVTYAQSLASLQFYAPDRKDRFALLARLHPDDPGVKHREYGAHWDSLNDVERSLFQWLEINGWAEELRSAHPDSFLTVRSEDVLAKPEGLVEAMVEREPFLAEVFRERADVERVVDKLGWSRTGDARRPVEVDGRSLRLSPEVPRLAERYGYSMDSSQAKKLT